MVRPQSCSLRGTERTSWIIPGCSPHFDRNATIVAPVRYHACMPEKSATSRPKRIVITTFGSLGDLHPYIAIALGLAARGHEPIVATAECYRKKIEALGLTFRPVRPDCDWVKDPRVMPRFMNLRWGLYRLAREMALPALRDTYEDVLAAANGADLIFSQYALGARLVAEKTGITWVSSIHMPMFFFSTHDLPVLPVAPKVTRKLRWLGPAFWRPVYWCAKRASRFLLADPWFRLRAELGLPATNETNPLLDSHSPHLVLALFSRLLTATQPDWPRQTVITGFPFFDQHGQAALPPELVRFLDDGPAPIVFTLGTAVAAGAGRFFEHSAKAASLLGRRAVLILNDPRNRLATLPSGVVAFEYARFSELFPRAAAIVHHGGIGSTGLAMRSGRPMLIMPCAWDQPDNADRAVRLGIARTISPRHYTPEYVATELKELLENPAYSQRALEVADQLRNEDGVQAACDALEALLHNCGHVPPGG